MTRLVEVCFKFLPVSGTVTALLSQSEGETLELHLRNYDADALRSLLLCTPPSQIPQLVDEFLSSVDLPPMPGGGFDD